MNTRSIRSMNKWPYIFVAPYVLAYLTFGLFPIIYTFVISLTRWDGISDIEFVGLRNYIRLFTTDPFFLRSIGNTAILMLMYIPLTILIGLLMANLLNSGLLPIRNAFRLVNFFPYITIPVAVGLIFALMFDWTTGAVNGILMELGIIPDYINWLGDTSYVRYVVALMLVWKFMGYHMMIYSAGLAAIPTELYEAADIDGAGYWQKFFYVSLPRLRPITLFLLVTNIIYGFQLFDEPRLLLQGWGTGNPAIGGPGRVGLTAVWFMFDTAFGSRMEFGLASSIAFSTFLFIFVFSLISVRIYKGNIGGND